MNVPFGVPDPGPRRPHTTGAAHAEELPLAIDALGRGQATFWHFFEANPAVMLLIDPSDGSLTDANDSAATYYGWTREQLRRMHVTELIAESTERVASEMELARAQGRHHVELRHRTRRDRTPPLRRVPRHPRGVARSPPPGAGR